MRFNLKKTPVVAFAACLALVCHLNSQSQAINFRIDDPIPVTNQEGQKILLVGMQGNSVTFQFTGTGMGGAEASIPVDPDSRIRLSYSYPDNFSDIQFNV